MKSSEIIVSFLCNLMWKQNLELLTFFSLGYWVLLSNTEKKNLLIILQKIWRSLVCLLCNIFFLWWQLCSLQAVLQFSWNKISKVMYVRMYFFKRQHLDKIDKNLVSIKEKTLESLVGTPYLLTHESKSFLGTRVILVIR